MRIVAENLPEINKFKFSLPNFLNLVELSISSHGVIMDSNANTVEIHYSVQDIISVRLNINNKTVVALHCEPKENYTVSNFRLEAVKTYSFDFFKHMIPVYLMYNSVIEVEVEFSQPPMTPLWLDVQNHEGIFNETSIESIHGDKYTLCCGRIN